jgi:peptide deformylase
VPHPLLRQVSTQFERIDADALKLADDMLETMYDAPGIGLAAVQVAVPKRLIVIDAAEDDEPRQPMVMFNPEILSLGSEMRLHEEGCLSIPDVRVEIERPSQLRVRYVDRQGELREMEAEGLLATAIQHEVDHLNGKLILDFLSRLKRDMVIKKLKKMVRA